MFGKGPNSRKNALLAVALGWALCALPEASRADNESATIDHEEVLHETNILSEGCTDFVHEQFVPLMLGDYIGSFAFGAAPAPNTQPRALARTLTRFKVADNNSPRPMTRFLYSYNYFRDAFDTDGDIHRNFLGAELAFFNQRASIEIRTSINRLTDFDSATSRSDISDLRTTLKALVLDSRSLDLVAGIAIGWPISDAPAALADDNVYLAPYYGVLLSPPGSRFYVQGFQQLDIPTEDRDQVLLHSDLGVGYFLRRYDSGRFVRTIAPTAELHAYTPIGSTGGIYRQLNYDDVINLTLGATAVLPQGLTLALGLGVPVSTDKDYDVEFQFHLNWLFGAAAPR